MAEYNMTYNDLKELIEQYIQKSDDEENLSKYKAEILSALTAGNDIDISRENQKDVSDMVTLWQNQIKEPSQLLLGTRYIRIKDCMIVFLKIALTSGLIDWMIGMNFGLKTISVATSADIVFGLKDVLKCISKLDDWDFCIYNQAVYHYKTHKEFTKDEMLAWLPCGEKPKCNMHDEKWDCEYLDDNDNCLMVSSDKVDSALESLIVKNLLEKQKKDGQTTYKFRA